MDTMDTKRKAPASIDDYIAAQASTVQPVLQRIRMIVREEAPDAEETITASRGARPCPTR
jgi:uncharacterized protein YdhG (YjbR/CyaY superfamily)